MVTPHPQCSTPTTTNTNIITHTNTITKINILARLLPLRVAISLLYCIPMFISNHFITVLHLNGTNMLSTHTCEILFSALSPHAHKGHIIPSLKSSALLSLGQLYDDNRIILLNKCTIKIY